MHCYCCCGIRLFDSEALWQLMNRAHSFSRTTLPNSVGQFAKFSSSPWQNRPYFAACRNRTFGSKLISILLKKLPLLKAGIVLIYAGLWVEENCQFFWVQSAKLHCVYLQLCHIAIVITPYTLSQKSTPDIFNCHLKTNYQILIIFGMNIPDTTCHQMTIHFFTSPNVCFWTTWGKHNQRNIIFYPMKYDC